MKYTNTTLMVRSRLKRGTFSVTQARKRRSNQVSQEEKFGQHEAGKVCMMAGNIIKVFESSAECENKFISVANLLF